MILIFCDSAISVAKCSKTPKRNNQLHEVKFKDCFHTTTYLPEIK